MNKPIIIDTSVLVALINHSDPYHAWAVQQRSKIPPFHKITIPFCHNILIRAEEIQPLQYSI